MFRHLWRSVLASAVGLFLIISSAGSHCEEEDETPGTAFLRDAEGQPVLRDPEGWRLAVPGWLYDFPRDHFAHRDYKTEWWYFTGHLEGEQTGAEYGFQLTWFRQGVIPPGERPKGEPGEEISRWVTPQMSFAHFAVSDVDRKEFFFEQTVSRGALGQAGFGEPPQGKLGSTPLPLAWINGWTLEIEADAQSPAGITYTMTAAMADGTVLELRVTPERTPVFHGADGVSQKAAGLGQASHYYSFTRMTARGSITVPGREPEPVSGIAWFDQEWASNQLAEDQVGWDWFSLKFDDGAELMIYQIRLSDGSGDAASKGTYISPEGRVIPISSEDYTLTPLKSWTSPESGGEYPLHWRIQIPRLNLDITTVPAFETQELLLSPVIYWEGVIRFAPTSGAGQLRSGTGTGYMELTGYAAPLEGVRGQGTQG